MKRQISVLLASTLGCGALPDEPPSLSEEIECRFAEFGTLAPVPGAEPGDDWKERWHAFTPVSAGSGVATRLAAGETIRTQVSCRLGDVEKEDNAPTLWYRPVLPWRPVFYPERVWESHATCAVADGRFQYDSHNVGLVLYQMGFADREDPTYPQFADIIPGPSAADEYLPGFEFKLQACAELRDGPVRLEMELIACPPTDLDCTPHWTLPTIRRFEGDDGHEDAPCW